jgi:hypothetical protein
MTQARFVSVACVLVDRTFLDRSVYDGESMRQKLLGFLLVVVLYNLSEFLDLGAQHRPVAPVDRVSFETSPPLSKSGLMNSHFYLLKRNDMIKHLFFYVNCPPFQGGGSPGK